MNALLRLLASLILIVASIPSCSAAPSSSTAAQAQIAAKLTEAKGSVYKRSFIDWNREEWGDPAPAKAGDALNEGMQVGTGDNSWAQISWTNIKTRAWANSVYAIAPNQRLVYLIGGEMLFQLDKNRKDKSEYHVWTNLLHARIRGTTVLVQSTGDLSRVTCLEGHIDVVNRTDNSVIHLKPGAVYEIKSIPSVGGGAERDAASVVSRPTASLSSLTPIAAANTGRPVFETARTSSMVYLVDKQAVLGHPLLSTTNFSEVLPSLPLIGDALGALGLPNLINQIVPQTLKHVMGDVFEIAQLPTRLNYRIGPDAGGLFHVNPSSLSLQPPDGILNLPETAMLLDPKASPVLGSAAGLMTQISPLSPQSQLLPGVTALPGVSSITGATGSLSSLSAISGTTASLGTVTSTVTNTASSTLSTVSTTTSSTLNSVTGLVGGTVGRVTAPLTGGGGSGGGLGGVLQNLGGGLGGLLGH